MMLALARDVALRFRPQDAQGDGIVGPHFILNVQFLTLSSAYIDQLVTYYSLPELKHIAGIEVQGASLAKMVYFLTSQDEYYNKLASFIRKLKVSQISCSNIWADFNNTNINNNFNGTSVENVMSNWPIFNIPFIEVNNDISTGSVTIKAYLSKPETISENLNWEIPLIYHTKDDGADIYNGVVTVKKWLKNGETYNIKIKPHSWLIVNTNQTAPITTNYNEENWDLLIRQLGERSLAIPTFTRMQLIDSAFQLAYEGKLNYRIPIGLTKYMQLGEKEYDVWRILDKHLTNLEIFFLDPGYIKQFQHYVEQVFLSLENSGDMNKEYYKFFSFKWQCRYDKGCKTYAVANPLNIKNLGIGDETTVTIKCNEVNETLITPDHLIGETNSSQAQTEITNLICTEMEHIVPFLDRSISDPSFPIKYTKEIWRAPMTNKKLISGMFDYFCNNWNQICQSFQDNLEVLDTIIGSVTYGTIEDYHLKKLTDIEKEAGHKEAHVEILQLAKRNIRRKIEWKNELRDQLGSLLEIF